MKTAKGIDNWIKAECDTYLATVPPRIKEYAKQDAGYTLTIAEMIAIKKGFRVKSVCGYLRTLGMKTQSL